MNKTYQGADKVAFARKLSAQTQEQGHLIPWRTSLSFDPSRDTNTTTTVDGVLTSFSEVETDLEVDFVNNSSAIADAFYDSLFNKEILEFWIVNKARTNASGQYECWYIQVLVTEDSNDNDADDISERDVTFTPLGSPKHGWTTLPAEAEEALDYIFRGLDKVTPASGSNPESNGGTPWKATDNGTDASNDAPASQAPSGN